MIFSTVIDVAGVAELLQSLPVKTRISGSPQAWKTIEIVRPKSGFFKRPEKLTFIHSREYYEGADWPMQLGGLREYIATFRGINDRIDILKLISTFRFGLATRWEPEIDMESADERLEYLFLVAKHLDGIIFRPAVLRDDSRTVRFQRSAVLDASGRVLIGWDGEYDSMAKMPDVDLSGIAFPVAENIEESKDEPAPPSAQRIARRALALCAVTARALLEQENTKDPTAEERRREIENWISASGFGDELEPDEWKVIQRRVGTLNKQETVDSTWRLEGLAVLAWALNLIELPNYDKLVDPSLLLSSVGFLSQDRSTSLIVSPTVRAPDQLQALSEQLFALHWRLLEYSLRPGSMDFVKFAQEAWFGPLDISTLRIKNKDLALEDDSIKDAPKDLSKRTLSSITERRIAINWLTGSNTDGIYSHTTCPT